jgi:hypothetical protein
MSENESIKVGRRINALSSIIQNTSNEEKPELKLRRKPDYYADQTHHGYREIKPYEKGEMSARSIYFSGMYIVRELVVLADVKQLQIPPKVYAVIREGAHDFGVLIGRNAVNKLGEPYGFGDVYINEPNYDDYIED